ncbi:hypothetical protein B0H15DRAFT_955861 [Mycena belliarum]|uniref:Uncharacterized protein n=1 Tax=Mycena belliarum TaxID=1033014 RepID=A0AAD6XJT7_9AGAR|nr:hypothetical protein B0H15DRAFT_955861 [Mycena belliae]
MLARLQVVMCPPTSPHPLAQPSNKGCWLRLCTHQVVHTSLPRTPRSTPPLPPSDRAAPAPLDYTTYSYSHEAVLVHRRKRRVLSYGASSRHPDSRPLLLRRAVKLTPHVRSGTNALTHSHEARFPHAVPRHKSARALDPARPKESPVRNPLGCVPGTRTVRAALYVHQRRRTVPLGPSRRSRSHSNAHASFPSPAAIRGSRADSCRRVRPPAGAPCTASAAFPFHPAPALRACPRLRPALNSRLPHRAPRSSRLPLPPIPRPSTPIPSRRPSAPHVASMRLAHPARRRAAPASKVSTPLGYTARDSRTSACAPRTFSPSPPSSQFRLPDPDPDPDPDPERGRLEAASRRSPESRVPSPESRRS